MPFVSARVDGTSTVLASLDEVEDSLARMTRGPGVGLVPARQFGSRWHTYHCGAIRRTTPPPLAQESCRRSG